MSSLRDVPPVVTITCTPRCLPSSLHTCDVCSASSRVGTSRIAWMMFLFTSTFSSTGMVNAAVLPVPFLARARISRPVRDGNGLLLDGGGSLETLLEDAHEELALEEVILKLVTLVAVTSCGPGGAGARDEDKTSETYPRKGTRSMRTDASSARDPDEFIRETTTTQRVSASECVRGANFVHPSRSARFERAIGPLRRPRARSIATGWRSTRPPHVDSFGRERRS